MWLLQLQCIARTKWSDLFKPAISIPTNSWSPRVAGEKHHRVLPERKTGHHLQEKRYGEFVD
jgi:hypothetical protein